MSYPIQSCAVCKIEFRAPEAAKFSTRRLCSEACRVIWALDKHSTPTADRMEELVELLQEINYDPKKI